MWKISTETNIGKKRRKYLAVSDIFLNTHFQQSHPLALVSPRLKKHKYSKKTDFRPSATLTDGSRTYFYPSTMLTELNNSMNNNPTPAIPKGEGAGGRP